MLYKLSAIILPCLFWAVYAQTIGHVWVFTGFAILSILGIKFILPNFWTFSLGLFLWWGISSTYKVHYLQQIIINVACYVFGRNLLYFSNR